MELTLFSALLVAVFVAVFLLAVSSSIAHGAAISAEDDAINKNNNSPANMLPKSRIPREKVFAANSTKFNKILNGNIAGPNGAVHNSLMKPPKPLILKE